MSYIDIKLGNEHIIQRNKFSKITIENDNGSKYVINDLFELPPFQQKMIAEYLKVKENPYKYFQYKINEHDTNTITLTKYIGESEHVVIPSEINGFVVTNIENIFPNLTNDIKTIIFPETLMALPSKICDRLKNLKFVQLPSLLEVIPNEAFYHCESLEHINLKNIKEVGNYAFNYCLKLEKIDSEKIKKIGRYAFYYLWNLQELNLPNVREIDEMAFHRCAYLKKVSLGDNVTEINRCVFSCCYRIEELKLPNYLVEIKEGAFEGCLGLKEVKLPNTLRKIGERGFRICRNLESINFPETLEEIGDAAFVQTKMKGPITFPKNLIRIGYKAFLDCIFDKVDIAKATKYYKDTFDEDVTIDKYNKRDYVSKKEIEIEENER